ncbi:MAG TPA: PHP-associated domain-containing protein [Bryobacteraceae bacterium]|nr:PHP-associated domain-containing protein [Bryobacteraceae bacterium]
MRCDLHVHTIWSGMCTVPALNKICRESYNEPRAVHDTLKGRGMDLITITDHDSIDAAEEFRGRPDFFISEEVSCTTPCGSRIHLGVYDITERDHFVLQRRRDDLPAAIAYLRERRIPFSINHAFSSLTGRRSEKDWDLFGAAFPAFETRNGTMLASCNKAAANLALRLGKIAVAGSDAHTLAGLGETYTEVPGARNLREFLEGLRSGASLVCGAHGNYAKLTEAVWNIGISLMREHPACAALAPLMLAVPVVTLANCLGELVFAWIWTRRLERMGAMKTHRLRSNPAEA